VHWQLHHQLTTSLVTAGNRVLFVENTGIRSVNLSDINRLSDRISNWKKGVHGFSTVNKNRLTLYSPMLLPFPYSKTALYINQKIFNVSIHRWIKSIGFNNSIVISFLPTPLIQDAIKFINPVLTIYYCANNMADSSESASKVKPYEDYFFKNVDLVITAAHVIQEYAEKFSNNVHYIPPGIDFDKFNKALNINNIPSDIANISSPIIGYIGTLGKVFDQKLVCKLAEKLSGFTIVLIGPEYTDIDLLKSKSNIIFLGVKPHDQLPYYIKEFNVGIVPYLCNDFTKGVYPSKLNEYLAMGIPAVSTNLREVRESASTYGNAAVIAKSDNEFIDSVKSLAFEKNNDKLVQSRINAAKANSWKSRFNNFSSIVQREVEFINNDKQTKNWKEQFNYFFHIQSKRRKLIFAAIFGYLIVFYTPLFWFLGKQLIVNNTIKIADAIVVFSGDGMSSYRNMSYQDRALDAINLYKKGYSDKIFLSSGREQTIADVEIIRLFLASKGVSDSNIYVHEEYPDSTYNNVLMVKDSLEKNDVKSILFLTSPYHSLRSTLTWKKNAPDIEITTPDISNKFDKDIQWGIGLDKIRVVIYEYVAIVHNWIFGRI